VTPPFARQGVVLVRHGDREYHVEVAADGTVVVMPGGERVQVTRLASDTYRVTTATDSRQVVVAASGDRRSVFADGDVVELEIGGPSRPRRAGRRHADALVAPMPARVREVLVAAGQAVAEGDVLVTLEAMKMELAVRAPHGGRVTSVACRAGELVQQGVTLVEIHEQEKDEQA